jgi:hypothetical protein
MEAVLGISANIVEKIVWIFSSRIGRDEHLAAEVVNKRPSLTPPSFGRSIA